MRGFFTSPVMVAILAFLALIAASLFIWFVGPLIALGDLHPLADVSLRVSVICLLLVLVILALLKLPLSVVGVACICLLIWHAGPVLAFGAWHPLEPVWVRAMVIGVVLFLYAVWGLYKVWNLMRNDEAFARKLLRRDDKAAGKVLAREEVRSIKEKANKAVAQLRQMHITMAGGTGTLWSWMRRIVEGKRYLYELPWYMIIGTPGTGKSSVLLNSGLQFPVADQMGAASAQLTLAQSAGTQNCAWWFTNEAVLIDTAGRYTNPHDGRSEQAQIQAAQRAALAKPEEADAEGKEPKKVVEESSALASDEQRNVAEWQGFLRVLRQVRPRAPINGALLAVDVSKLLSDDANQSIAHAAQLRARLAELREHLGIRFPVYVVLTKMDLLRGFTEYFSSLTTEARAQVWGFTLPWRDSASPEGAQPVLAQQLKDELLALHSRIRAGTPTRLQEEFDLDRRQALYLFAHEFAALIAPLVSLLDAVFADSRYDTTQLTHSLRGVYLTSAMQYEQREVTADRLALVPRLHNAMTRAASKLVGAAKLHGQPQSTRSYFMADLFSRVVFPEAHLVKPNLRWEARFRMARLTGHALVFFLCIWLSMGLKVSHSNNQEYLAEVKTKTAALTEKMRALLEHRSSDRMLDVLALAQELPKHSGLELEDPALSYTYGLYTADPIAAAAHVAYGDLQDRLILPVIIDRMEAVMRKAVQYQDAKHAYDTLHVYMLLHDKPHFTGSPSAAQEVRNWVLQDWQDGLQTDEDDAADGKDDGEKSLASTFNNSTAMVSYLQDMFSGKRVVQSSTSRNEALVRQVRTFLDSTPGNERLYERVKGALAPDVPQDFTLVRALGPQVGTLFSLASGSPLEYGVPGLFTYDGYHELFAKRLKELVVQAQIDDAWVMGRTGNVAGKVHELSEEERQTLIEDIRSQYLQEYAQLWTDFLADIRVVKADSGRALTFELNMLRQLAAPDSALVRLARMAARETTLSRSLQTRSAEEKSLFDKATEQLDKNAEKLNKNLGLRPEQRIERQYVDSQFGALREVVTGQGDGSDGQATSKVALDKITSLLNEYYTSLVVADAAINGGSIPPSSQEAATKIKIEASKLPAPFREILLGATANGADKISQAAASILRVQAQAQMDRLVSTMNQMVIEPCRRNIAGRYPFADTSQEVAIDDFNAFFGAGGSADEYFNKYLAPLVDTSERPWHYKNPVLAAAPSAAAEGGASATATPVNAPTVAGELLKLMAQSGPNPDLFAQIQQIREVYFKEPGAKRMAWKLDVRVQSLDPSITELVMDFDGQTQRYAHGPVQALQVQWPGPRSGTMAEITALPRIKSDTSSVGTRGPWALMRLVEQGNTIPSASAGKVAMEFAFDTRRTVLEVTSSGANPLSSNLLKSFNCSGRTS
ncbi:type VI secretion system membrane subunit TssM [Curvibacter sp. CHRR-16]|uniref:type VI secretion system membrane subunit TssM n=1 Tax=Curvibacter sp. CHRR-16 TaxID=2835872 RepID=UPI001BDA84F4|nr:type VI secretion system membrane subunit TssM [Curvibacter sp. CHRR-16]MBT0571845.1 type VI secretion system membrane subunit TssM [Curvibacter sp. CHRR-16]